MSEEQKVETTTTEKKVDDTQKVETPEVKTEEVKTEKESVIDNGIDYKAKYEGMKESARKAFEERKEKREKKEEVIEKIPEEEKPVTKKDLDELLVRQEQTLDQKVQATKVESLIGNLTGSEDEANLVKTILNDTKFPTGFSLEQQVNGAIAIANSDKLIGERDEAFRALKGKSGVSKDPSGTYREGQVAKTSSTLGDDMELVLKQTGFVYNEQNRRFEKKTESGKLMIYDEKTKRNVLVE